MWYSPRKDLPEEIQMNHSRQNHTKIESALFVRLPMLLVLMFGALGATQAQWTTDTSTNNIYYNAGSVGVGTTTPGTFNGSTPLNTGKYFQIRGPATAANTAALIINGYDYSQLLFSSQ